MMRDPEGSKSVEEDAKPGRRAVEQRDLVRLTPKQRGGGSVHRLDIVPHLGSGLVTPHALFEAQVLDHR